VATDWDVIVVGGGMCGVSLASELERALGPQGRVLLLEANAELGGRTRVRETEDGRSVDLGAHYLGEKHRRALALAKRLCPDELFERSAVYGPDPASRAFIEGKFKVTPRSRTFFDLQGLEKDGPLYDRLSIMHSMAGYLVLESLVNVEEPWKTPFAASLDKRTWAEWIEKQAVPSWIHDMWGLAALGMLSARTRELSLLYWLWYQAANAGMLFTGSDYKGGAQEFSLRCGLGGLLKKLAAGLQHTVVRLEAPVSRVEHEKDGLVRVTLRNGATETARRVVIAATPSAVHKHVTFEPPLSPARARMHAQRMGHAAKAMLSYEKPFWHQSFGHHIMSYSGGPRAEGMEWGLDTTDPKTGAAQLMFFVAPNVFEKLGPNPDKAAIERAVIDAAVEITGEPAAAKPTRVDVQIWEREEFVPGGPNTVMEPGVLTSLAGVLGEPEGPSRRLYFASSEQTFEFPGYVEGALSSAERAAGQVIRALEAEDGLVPVQRPAPLKALRRGNAVLYLVGGALGYVLLAPVVWLLRLFRRKG
jgi:monoamine oxidase